MDYQWDVDVFLEPTTFPWWKPMLVDMKSTITCVEDVGVVQNTVLFKSLDDVLDDRIDCLQCSEALAVQVIIARDVL